MREIPNDILFEVRLIERHLAQNLLTREDVQKHLEKLPDSTDLARTKFRLDVRVLSTPDPLAVGDRRSFGSGQPAA